MAVESDKSKCIYCGGCVAVCPQNALTLKETFIECNDKCNDCGFCVKFCPVGALSFVKK